MSGKEAPVRTKILTALLLCLFAFALLAGLAACSGTRTLREGMSQAEVSKLLGPPLKITKHDDGSESWSYTVVSKRRVREIGHNYERPGESIYERDLRLDTEGAFGGVEITTIEKHEEAAVRFDRSGRLAHSPPQDFLPRR